jgi:hypothetical protein
MKFLVRSFVAVSIALTLLVSTLTNAQSLTWVSVTPGDVILGVTDVPGWADNFGTAGMTGDPARQGHAYFSADHQGIWRTTDSGLSWTKIYTATGNFNGLQWSMIAAPSGTWMIANNGYGTGVGVFRSTDQGVTWEEKISSDINDVSLSPVNENHILATAHDNDGNWYESRDGGVNWTNLGPQDPGNFQTGRWLDGDTWIGNGQNGLWRGERASGTWVWTQELVVDSPHGGSQMYRDAVNGFFYVGASTVEPIVRHIYRTTLADGGVNWIDIGTFGSGYGMSTLFGTPGKLYAQANYAQHTFYDPSPHQALSSDGLSWSTGPTTTAQNGAHSAAVVCNGSVYILLTANTNDGIWRYETDESCASGVAGGKGRFRIRR